MAKTKGRQGNQEKNQNHSRIMTRIGKEWVRIKDLQNWASVGMEGNEACMKGISLSDKDRAKAKASHRRVFTASHASGRLWSSELHHQYFFQCRIAHHQ